MIEVERTRCELCGTCVGVCQADAIYIERDMLHVDDDRCVHCGACCAICPVGALSEGS